MRSGGWYGRGRAAHSHAEGGHGQAMSRGAKELGTPSLCHNETVATARASKSHHPLVARFNSRHPESNHATTQNGLASSCLMSCMGETLAK